MIEITINGRPLTKKNIEDKVNNVVLESIAEQVDAKIRSLVKPEEAAKLKIDLVGDDLEDLSINIHGPDEAVILKIEKVFSEAETE